MLEPCSSTPVVLVSTSRIQEEKQISNQTEGPPLAPTPNNVCVRADNQLMSEDTQYPL